jgi:hypothetical protein
VAEPGSADACIFAVGAVMVKLCRQLLWRHIDSEQNSVCIIYIYLLFVISSLFFTTHPIELEGVHILTKAHERAPVCWCFPPPLGSPMCEPLLTAVHDQICL